MSTVILLKNETETQE